MKHRISALIFLGSLILASFSIASAANYSSSGDDSCCCCPSNCKILCAMRCEGVEVNVENVKDGVVVKITSKSAEVVKNVQKMYAKRKEMCAQKEYCKEEEPKKEMDILQ